MNQYVILIALTTYCDLGTDAQSEKNKRRSAIFQLVFSLGPAWHAGQGSILLKSSLSRDEVVERLAPLVTASDFVGVMEVDAKSITTIGWNADEEGLDALYSGVLNVDGTVNS